MSFKDSLDKAESDADALILGTQNKSTANPSDTDDVKTQPNQNPSEHRTPASSDSEKMWEHKYKALQGKFHAEVPILHKTVADLRQQLAGNTTNNGETERYKSEISTLKSQLESANTQLEARGQSSANTRDEYLDEEYGEEFTNSLDKRIDAKTEATNQQLRQMQEANQNNQTEMRKATLTEMLKAQGINFDQVDSDPMFHQWLSHVEGNTRQQRQVFLNQNFVAGDLRATAAYYTDFKAHERSSFKTNPLDSHVDVSDNNSSPDDGSDGDYWTTDDVERLYDDHRTRRIDDATFDKFEQQFFRAREAGRFRG